MKTLCEMLERIYNGSKTFLLVIMGMFYGYKLMMADKLTAEGVVMIVGAIGAYAWRAVKRPATQTSIDGKEQNGAGENQPGSSAGGPSVGSPAG